MGEKELYAGDAAWNRWFETCAVALCGEHEEAVRRQVESACSRALGKFGISARDYREWDLVTHFDTHFSLRGGMTRAKPYKRLLQARIPGAKDGLKGVVCGTLFSPLRGAVQTIARDIIVVEKGWRAVYKRGFRHKCGSVLALVKAKSVVNMERVARNVCNARPRTEARRVVNM